MSPTNPSKAERRDAAREKARQLREEQERRRKRANSLLVVAAVVVVLAMVLVIGLVIRSASQDPQLSAAAPDNVTAEGGFVLGEDDAPVTVSVYADYQCPACKNFEAATEAMLSSMVEQGAVKVVEHPISILDRVSGGTEYSTRAASAAMCVADQAPDAFETFHQQMFVNQPTEGENGLDDATIITIATLAGAPSTITQCVEERTYEDYVSQATDVARDAGLPGTPWVLVDGEPLAEPDPALLESAIHEALKQRGGMNPTPTGSGTGTQSATPTAPATS